MPIAGLVICCVNDDEDAARREAKAQIAFYVIVRTYQSIIGLEGFVQEAGRLALLGSDGTSTAW